MRDPIYRLIVLSERIWNCRKSLAHTHKHSEIKIINNAIINLEELIPKLKIEVELLKELYK